MGKSPDFVFESHLAMTVVYDAPARANMTYDTGAFPPAFFYDRAGAILSIDGPASFVYDSLRYDGSRDNSVPIKPDTPDVNGLIPDEPTVVNRKDLSGEPQDASQE